MGWKSLDDLFQGISEEEYVVMRNYDFEMQNLIKGEDIDFLCENRGRLVQKMGAFPIREGENVYNYRVEVAGINIRVDIREIGDGYYDSIWERAMLDMKVGYKEFYIMDREDYAYSLLYHSLIHKPEMAFKYKVILNDYFGVHIGLNRETDELLCRYLISKGYHFTKPMDEEVEFNLDNFYRMDQICNSISSNYVADKR